MNRVAGASADIRSGEEDDRRTARPAPVSLLRLHILRFGYLVVGGGLVAYRWPSLLRHDQPWPLMEGVVTCMLVALSLLALLGLRYPLQMLPVLLFEVAWKLIWLAAVALPLWTSGGMDPATEENTVMCFWVVIPLVVVPWRYVFAQYVRQRGDRWGSTPSRRATDMSPESSR
jgi:hypothetical protein